MKNFYREINGFYKDNHWLMFDSEVGWGIFTKADFIDAIPLDGTPSMTELFFNIKRSIDAEATPNPLLI